MGRADVERHIRAAIPIAAALAVLAVASVVPAQQRRLPGYASEEPDWRFSRHDRPVKVVILAGSIGAFYTQPYGRLLQEWCVNTEVRNLSRVGEGALQLASRFQHEVLENHNIPIGAPHYELWVLFGGGMNSVGIPQRTNRAVLGVVRRAHQRHVGVVAFTLTPWGTTGDEDDRWAYANAARTLRFTRTVVDFVMGRLSPRGALGDLVSGRGRGEADWTEEERPDVAIDLYDSPLRDRDATPWNIDEVRAAIESDARWRRDTAQLSNEERAQRLERDARLVSEAPRWFLRPEYRSFDHIHPNREGHEVIARTACPQLPESWGCRCPQGS